MTYLTRFLRNKNKRLVSGFFHLGIIKCMRKITLKGGLAIGITGEIKGLYEAWKIGGNFPGEISFSQPS